MSIINREYRRGIFVCCVRVVLSEDTEWFYYGMFCCISLDSFFFLLFVLRRFLFEAFQLCENNIIISDTFKIVENIFSELRAPASSASPSTRCRVYNGWAKIEMNNWGEWEPFNIMPTRIFQQSTTSSSAPQPLFTIYNVGIYAIN